MMIAGLSPRNLAVFAALAIVAVPAVATAAGGHTDPVTPVVLALAVILAAAKLGGEIAVRLGQPAVLGELLVGVVLGNLELGGVRVLSFIEADTAVDILARLGVILLLFEVGLESTVRDMLKVGLASLLVAVLGVLAPFALGFGVGQLLLPGSSLYVHLFLGATLTATSVGITARVLKDLGQSQTPSARVILGAAVIDDVLGLVILAVVAGVIVAADRGTALSHGAVALIIGKSALFLLGALALGTLLSPRLFRFTSRLRGGGLLLATGLVLCFAFAYGAALLGLAPIVGAYAAGLILEPVHFQPFTERGEVDLEDLVKPISAFLVPVFFVLMGMKVDLLAFARPEVLGLAALLTVAAIAGKQACSLGAVGPGLDRLSIGIGMIPRGEVGLIFANLGLTLTIGGARIVDEGVFSAVVIMVIITTMATPPILKWSLTRNRGRSTGGGEVAAGGRDGA